MSEKKYVSLSRLSDFLENLYDKFAPKNHEHQADSQLSSTSTNPVQNKVLDAEFEAISVAMNTLEDAIDSKSDKSHNHNDVYYTETEMDNKLDAVNTSISNITSNYETKDNASAKLSEAKLYTDTQIAAIPTPDVSGQIEAHNEDTSAHEDIRTSIDNLSSEIDNKLNNKADSTHDHNDVYYTKAYVDDAVSHRTQVQIITWGADD